MWHWRQGQGCTHHLIIEMKWRTLVEGFIHILGIQILLLSTVLVFIYLIKGWNLPNAPNELVKVGKRQCWSVLLTWQTSALRQPRSPVSLMFSGTWEPRICRQLSLHIQQCNEWQPFVGLLGPHNTLWDVKSIFWRLAIMYWGCPDFRSSCHALTHHFFQPESPIRTRWSFVERLVWVFGYCDRFTLSPVFWFPVFIIMSD